MFDRNKSRLGQTFSFRVFKKHHTELNDLYWSFTPAYHYLQYVLDGVDPDALTKDVFCLSGDESRRPPRSISSWKTQYKNFLNWTRLNSLLSICAYFEIYLKRALTTALLSDPGLLILSPKSVDGIKLVKGKIKIETDHLITGFTKGTWHDRVNRILNVFGKMPQELIDNTANLDRLRTTRNNIGHSFGRSNDDFDDLTSIDPMTMEAIGESRLKKYLDLTLTIAESIDKYLLDNHIGDFEILLYYHNNIKNHKDLPKMHLKRDLLLRKHINSMLKTRYGATKMYCTSLIKYYDSQ